MQLFIISFQSQWENEQMSLKPERKVIIFSISLHGHLQNCKFCILTFVETKSKSKVILATVLSFLNYFRPFIYCIMNFFAEKNKQRKTNPIIKFV